MNHFPFEVAAIALGRSQEGTRRANWLFLLLMLPLLAACQTNFDDEFFVHSARSKVTVTADGTARVSELFYVQALTESNHGGVYLDIPQRFTDADGSVHWRDFLFTAARRNGKSQYFAIEYGPQGETVYIGERPCRRCRYDLPLGQNDIGLDYRLGRLVRREGNRDVLVLPAYLASIHDFRPKKSIVLTVPPGGVLKTSSNGEFGPQITRTGSTEFLIAFNERKVGRGPSEIEIEYPPGTFLPRSSFDVVYWWTTDHLNVLLTAIGVLSTAFFIVQRLRRLREDLITRSATLDQDLLRSTSPGLAAYLCRDDRQDRYTTGFLGSVCSLALMGAFRISSFDDAAQLEKLSSQKGPHDEGASSSRAEWPNSLRTAYEILDWRPLLERSCTVVQALTHAEKQFEGAVRREYGDALRKYARIWPLTPILVSLCGLVAYFAGLLYFLMSLVVALFIAFLAIMMLRNFNRVALSLFESETPWKATVGLFVIFPAVGVLAATYAYLNMPVPGQFGALIALLTLIGLLVFSWTLPRPFTPRLRKMRDNLLLLRRYMVGEIPKPDMSVELYERYLPFAVALGVEPDWTRSFTRWRAETGMTVYEPDWLISSAEKEKMAPA